MSAMDRGLSYAEIRKTNEKVASMINTAWGAKVAWVDPDPSSFPAIKSRLVGGLADGLRPPPFNAGPARDLL